MTGPAELIWAAMDLDGTLIESCWPDPGLGRPIPANVAKARELRQRGYKLVIHTARGWEAYQAIESHLAEHDIPFDKIVCGKLLARIYVDDRAVPASAAVWLPEYHGL